MTCSYNHLRLNIDTPETMEDVGSVLSSITQPGDVIFLDGDLGAGKTCFARGFIRSRSGISDLRVTSPTYLLCNTYPSYDHVPMYVAFISSIFILSFSSISFLYKMKCH